MSDDNNVVDLSSGKTLNCIKEEVDSNRRETRETMQKTLDYLQEFLDNDDIDSLFICATTPDSGIITSMTAMSYLDLFKLNVVVQNTKIEMDQKLGEYVGYDYSQEIYE